MKEDITIKSDNSHSVKESIEWLETRKKRVNVTIVIQSFGNIINSHLENVNTYEANR